MDAVETASSLWQTYAATAVEPVKQVLAGPLADLSIEEPLLTGIAAAPSAALIARAALFVAKAALEILLVPVLQATAATPSLKSQQYTRGRRLGSGAYGAVFEGYKGDEDEPSVVIKETSAKAELVDGKVANFGLAELFMNRKLSLCGQGGAMARFRGHYYYGGDLCLVYQREGELTLAAAMGARDFPFNLEEALTGREADGEYSLQTRAALVRKIAKQVFGALASVHGWSVVHRDVKGANLVLAERERRFKLVDFGAAVDTVSRTNYDSRIQVFDPEFGPPEADLWKKTNGDAGGFVIGAGGRFDVFSAGLLVMQMCFPPLANGIGAKKLKTALERVGYDLRAWRETVEGKAGYEDGIAILDKHGGWALLEGCLREEPGKRISSAAAASSGFCRVF